MEPYRIGRWLRRRAEDVAVLLLAVMFGSFIIQIVFRYVFNWPVGWTSEVSVLTWLWVVLWGAAFVLKDKEEIRFDILYGAVPARVRRAFVVVTGVVLVVLYAIALPASWNYVAFMKVERAAYLQVPMSWLYSIYILFAAGCIVRYGWLAWNALRGRDPAE